MTERSDSNIWPLFTSHDPRGLRAFLASLGFEEGICVEGDGETVQHSEMLWPEGGRLMVSSASSTNDVLSTPGAASVYVVTVDPDSAHDRAVRAGATIIRALEDADYGSRGFSMADPDGNVISFGTYGVGG